MNFQSKIGFVIVFLLIMQSFAVPVMACEMSSSHVPETEFSVALKESSSHDHHKMHEDDVITQTSEMMHSMTMSGDCCGENCQCPSATSYSSAMLDHRLVNDALLVSQRVKSKVYRALDAHTHSQFKPPIFA